MPKAYTPKEVRESFAVLDAVGAIYVLGHVGGTDEPARFAEDAIATSQAAQPPADRA